MNRFTITGFDSALIANDPLGRRCEFFNRRTAAFIITTEGSVRFSYEGGAVLSTPDHPVFLPRGLSYLNECTKTATSYVINLQTLHDYPTPLQLSPISIELAKKYYETLIRHTASDTEHGHLAAMETLYSLAAHLLCNSSVANEDHPLLTKALGFMRRHYDDPSLTVGDIARHCCISEVYLRKLFAREKNTSPHRALYALRMQRSRLLVEEKRPLQEIADSVGYTDLFQFSRAYKRYYGHAPSKDR